METNEIGCCGACCKTCIEQQKIKYPTCKSLSGLQVRYESGERALDKAKLEIKVCCSKDGSLETCADCSDYLCRIWGRFWNKNGWKYKKYKKQLEFIMQNGYMRLF